MAVFIAFFALLLCCVIVAALLFTVTSPYKSESQHIHDISEQARKRMEADSPNPTKIDMSKIKYPSSAPTADMPETKSPPVSSSIVSSISATKLDLHTITSMRQFKECILLDTETTGLSRNTDRVIEVGIAKMNGSDIAEVFNSLINPERQISQSASAVNGIFNSDVEDAPVFGDIAQEICEAVDGQVIAGYNVKFDIDFLGSELSRAGLYAKISYVDVLRLAREAYPSLENHKLETGARHLNLISSTDSQHHRAMDDAVLTGNILVRCFSDILSSHDEKSRRSKERREEADTLRRERYAQSPLLDKTFAFTGEFVSGREAVESMAANVGALLRTSVSSRLNYLVVGNVSNLPDWAIARKLGNADELIASGKNIQKISEAEYLKLISDALSSLSVEAS